MPVRLQIFFIRKPFFLPEPQFSQHNGRNQAVIFLIFFLTCIFTFSLIIYLIRFSTNNKLHFFNNEDRKEFQIRKKRHNFSLVARYSLKFSHYSLLIVKSLVTLSKIRALLVAEDARYRRSLVTRCKIRPYSLQKLLVAKICSL